MQFLQNKSKIFKKLGFYTCAVLALLIPDFLLRFLVWPKVFDEPFVTIIPTLFNLAWICTALFFCTVLLSKKIGKILYFIIGLIFIILSFANYIYFQIFEQFFWLSEVGLAGEASSYFRYALTYLDWKVVCATVSSFVLLFFAILLWQKPTIKKSICKLFTLIPLLVVLLLHIFMQPALFGVGEDDWDSWSKPRIIYKQFVNANKSLDVTGLYHFTVRDLIKSLSPSHKYDTEDYEAVDAFISAKPQVVSNDYTGIFEGKNIIAVMMESIDDWMVNDTYTPTIKYMMNNGINLKNHFAPTYGSGYTFNTEFAFNTGFYTPKSVASAVNFNANNFPYSLPNLFKEKGYVANSFHYNNPEFYNRGVMHQAFGYERYNCFEKLGIPSHISQNDSNILTDTVYAKMTENTPFFDFIITYSGHVPYTYDDEKLHFVKEKHPELVDPNMNLEKNNCLLLARDTDDFFRTLLERLHNDGLLENTVIIGFSDHYAYGFSDEELLKQYNKEAGSELLQRVPAFIYSPGMNRVAIKKVSQTSDLLPTIINLFGLENHNCYIGNDIFDDNYSGFAYFGDKSWFDGEIHFVPSNANNYPLNIKAYIDFRNQQIVNDVEINDIVIAGDYFK